MTTRNLIKFLLKISELKEMQRTGWVWRGVKNPETIAEHSFGTAFLTWVLGRKTKLNVQKMIEMGIIHDICEVYAGDLTPYYGIIPRDKGKRKEMLMRWVRLSQKEKISFAKKKWSKLT